MADLWYLCALLGKGWNTILRITESLKGYWETTPLQSKSVKYVVFDPFPLTEFSFATTPLLHKWKESIQYHYWLHACFPFIAENRVNKTKISAFNRYYQYKQRQPQEPASIFAWNRWIRCALWIDAHIKTSKTKSLVFCCKTVNIFWKYYQLI